jgi:hypothetical protein
MSRTEAWILDEQRGHKQWAQCKQQSRWSDFSMASGDSDLGDPDLGAIDIRRTVPELSEVVSKSVEHINSLIEAGRQ